MAKYVSPEGLDSALSAVSQKINTLSSEIPTKVSQLQNDSGYTTNKGTVTGVKINGTTKSPSSGVVDLGTVITAHQDISGKVDKVQGKGLSTNDFTTTLKNKLDGIASGAEVNQNAFSYISVGSTLLEADSTKDLLTLEAGDNITLTPNTSATKIIITANVPTLASLMGSSAIGGTSSYIYWDGSKWATKSLGTLAFSSATSFPASDVYSWAKASTKPSYTKSEVGLGNVTNDAQVKRSEMGVASGVATLDANGLVPTSQLPSYVDDVLEYTAKSSFPSTGATGKIYVDTSTNKTYRWGGSAYVEISASLALGTTSSTAYRGDLGKQNADNIATLQSYFNGTAANMALRVYYGLTVGDKTFNGSSAITITKSDLGLSNVGNFKAVSTVASQGLTSTEKSNARANIGAGTSNFDGAYSSLSGKPTIPTKVSELENDKAYLSSHQSIYGLTIKSSGGQTVKVYTPNQESAIVTLTKDIVGLGNVENKSSATIRGEITKANVTSALGTGTGTTKYLREDGSWATPPNTTYSSKTAASGGTDVSLVTTGEKYTWNSKQSAISDLSTIRTNASNGNTAYGWGNHASAGYQKASTAITTSNIGSQSVATATNADTVDGYHADDILPYGLENICIGVVAQIGNTTLNSDGSITTNGVNEDTYFSIRCTEKLVAGQIYTMGFYVTGVPSNNTKTWSWRVADQSNSNWPVAIYKNGWCWGTGTVPNDIAAGTNIIIDDVNRGFHNSITISNFIIVKGKQRAYYTPPISKMSVATATNVAWSGVTGKPSFATVATSGSYNDLSNKPTIPSNTNQLTNGAGFITGIKTLTLISGSTSVAFNGTSDGALNVEGTGGITVTPTKSGNVLTLSISGTAATTSANGLMSSTDKKKLDGIASGAEVNVQSDWNATSGDAFIKNKPTFLTGGSQTSTSSSDGGSNVFTFTKSDGTTATFTVKNGSKGSTGATGPQGPKGDTGPAGVSKALSLICGSTSTTYNGANDVVLNIAASNGITATPSLSGTALTVTISGNNASTSAKGVVQLSSSTSSTSTTLAATASAVKAAYDHAQTAYTLAAQTSANLSSMITVHEFTSTGSIEYTVTHNLNSTNVLVLGAYSAEDFTTGKAIYMWGGASYNPSNVANVQMQFNIVNANSLLLSFRPSTSYVPKSGQKIRVLILKFP